MLPFVWPAHREVTLLGMGDEPEVRVGLRKALRHCLENHRVKWQTMPVDGGFFDYLGFRYKLHLQEEEGGPPSISVIEKVGRLDADDDGEEVFVDTSNARKRGVMPTWGDW